MSPIAIRHPQGRRRRVLLLVLDGMRPSSIDPRLTPHLARLAAKGVTFDRSRTGFPSETMVGAGELFTGSYPERSGIVANWMPVPGSAPGGVELKSIDGIQQLADAYGGRALATTSVFQAMAGAGLTSAVVGKEGPAELASHGGATWTVSSGGAHASASGVALAQGLGVPQLDDLVRDAGPAPSSGKQDDRDRSAWLAKVATTLDAAYAPDLLTVWLTDPDKTQHNHGLGTRNQRDALRAADAAVGALLADMERRGSLDVVDIVVTSDHGFSDHLPAPKLDLAGVLRRAGLRASHVIGSGNQHLVRFEQPPTAKEFRRMRQAIARSPLARHVRTIIESPRSEPAGSRTDGRLTGRDLRQSGERPIDAYVVYRSDDAGIRGPRSRGGRGPAHMPSYGGTSVAGHGSFGWSDLNNTLMLSGPSIERAREGATRLRTKNAAGIFDVAPTILELLGVDAPAGMQGRVLREALVPGGGQARHAVAELQSRRLTATSTQRLGERTIRTRLVTELLGNHSYFIGLEATG